MHGDDIARLKSTLSPRDFYAAEQLRMPVTKKDSGWVDGGLCPFHEDRHRGNFRVNLDSGGFVCFSCGARGGDIIDYVRLRFQLNFTAAVDAICRTWGLSM
jgi:DNA primase